MSAYGGVDQREGGRRPVSLRKILEINLKYLQISLALYVQCTYNGFTQSGSCKMKTKIEADRVQIVELDYNIDFSLKESESDRVWRLRLDGCMGVQFISEEISNITKVINFVEFHSEGFVCYGFDYGSSEVQVFDFRVFEKESFLKIRDVYRKLVGDGFRIPNASNYNPNPEWLKLLVSKTGISRTEIAVKLGISLRGLDFNLMDGDSKNYRQMPYTSQFAIECLIPEVRFFRNIMLLA